MASPRLPSKEDLELETDLFAALNQAATQQREECEKELAVSTAAPHKGKRTQFRQQHALTILTDEERLVARQYQIDLGKRTKGYDFYTKKIPKESRDFTLKHSIHPVTPDINRKKLSKRGWDGLVRQWRRLLHSWDPSETAFSDFSQNKENILPIASEEKLSRTTPIMSNRKQNGENYNKPAKVPFTPNHKQNGLPAVYEEKAANTTVQMIQKLQHPFQSQQQVQAHFEMQNQIQQLQMKLHAQKQVIAMAMYQQHMLNVHFVSAATSFNPSNNTQEKKEGIKSQIRHIR